ncbi:MAG: hypothetical protein HKO07_06240, partial [Pseudomonadales bacterium]|nr:hypothetical protein [Pseudomonadales bacterium]
MSNLVTIIEAPLTQNLQPLSVYWAEQGLPHRIVEKSGQQLVLAPDNQGAQVLRSSYQAFSSGELDITLHKRERPPRP